jgi:phospholipase C
MMYSTVTKRAILMPMAVVAWGLCTSLWAQTPYFSNVVIIVQENRTPDNLFSACSISGADTEQNGPAVPIRSKGPAHQHSVFLHELKGKYPANAYGFVPLSDIQPYCDLATEYGFANQMFQTNQGPSRSAHLFLFAGTSQPSMGSSLFLSELGPDDADCVGTGLATFINPKGKENTKGSGCLDITTLPDLLTAAGLTWRYYTPSNFAIWSAPLSVQNICQAVGSTCEAEGWAQNVVENPPQVLTDIQNGTLANVSWVIPSRNNSDHPDWNTGGGPAWVTSIVDAVGNSAYWENTAIFITWDDWGGFWDHVPPTPNTTGFCSSYCYGFRVPLVVVSAYTPAGYVDNTVHNFGSILNFVETNFALGSLGVIDQYSDNMLEFFSSPSARAFSPVDPRGSFDPDDRGDPDDY